jgi:capsule synthesis protein PGA_cap
MWSGRANPFPTRAARDVTGRGRVARAIPFPAVAVVLALVVAGVVLARSALRDEDGTGRGAGPPAPSVPRADDAAHTSPTSTDASPLPGTAPKEGNEKRKGKLVVHGAGDVSLDPSYISTYAAHGYGYAWSGLGGLFREDDLTVVNLECAVSEKGSAVPKEFNFRGDPAALPAMRKAGVEVANLGNNHAYDFGPDALLDTVRNVRRAGVAPVGAGATQDEALDAAIFDQHGWRVAVVGLDQVVDPYPDAIATDTKPGTAAGHDVGLMLRAIRDAEREADLVVVAIHWGVELDTQPSPEQRALASRFVRAGADMIFGHHSHRLQPLDSIRGRPVFWSLGNFVWPNHSYEGSVTGVGRVVVTPRGDFRARLVPAFIEAPGHPVLG